MSSASGTKSHRTFLYRGDSRDPHFIFSEGFTAHAPELAQDSHTDDEMIKNGRAYISTSKSAEVAAMFPLAGPKDKRFIYVLNFVPEVRCYSDSEDKHGLQHCVVPKRIDPKEIKGVWKIHENAEENRTHFKLLMDCIEGRVSPEKLPAGLASYVPNPGYIERVVPLGIGEKIAKFVASFMGSAEASEPKGESLVTETVREIPETRLPVYVPPPLVLPPVVRPNPIANFAQHFWINLARQQDPFSATLGKLTESSTRLKSSSVYQSYSWINQQASSTRPSLFDSRAMESIDRSMVRSSFEDSVRWGDSYREAFDRANRSLGYPRGFDYDRFIGILRSTGLVSSYKNIHPWARISSYGLRFDIGGVAAEVGKIEGFEHSFMHLNGTPKFVLPVEESISIFLDAELQQILRELAQAIFIHEALPFFSLHFQPNSLKSRDDLAGQFSVIHPAYQQTLVGLIIAILDFWMKGFLNGGVYSEEFLKAFALTPNFNQEFLQAAWIDLQKYAEAHGLTYHSFQEKCFSAGLEKFSQDGGGLKFMVSFRILSNQQGAGFDPENGVFVLKPLSFRVEYTIEPKPEYAETLKQYRAEHGKYPEDYEKFDALCALEAKEIQTLMPKFPMFRKYFYLLDVITFLSYYFHNLKAVGRVPEFSPIPKATSAFCPEIFPSLPMRYFKKHEVRVSMEEVLFPEGDRIRFEKSALESNIDIALRRQFSSFEVEENLALFEKLKFEYRRWVEGQLKKIERQHEDMISEVLTEFMTKVEISGPALVKMKQEVYLKLKSRWPDPFEFHMFDHQGLSQVAMRAEVNVSTFDVPEADTSIKLCGGCGLDFSSLSLETTHLAVGQHFKLSKLGFQKLGTQSYVGFALGLRAEPVLSLLDYESLAGAFSDPLVPGGGGLGGGGVKVHSGNPAGLNPLFLALYQNKADEALAVLTSHPEIDLNRSVEKSVTPLHLALDLGMEEVSQVLIARGADPQKSRDSDGRSPWLLAAEKGMSSALRRMHETGRVNPEAVLPDGRTALHLAVEQGHLETVNFLISVAGSLIKYRDHAGFTPLMRAIQKGHVQVAEILIPHSDLSLKTPSGESLLLMAAGWQMWEIVDPLKSVAPEEVDYRKECIRQGKLRYESESRLSLGSRISPEDAFTLAVNSAQPMMARQLSRGLFNEPVRRQGWIRLDHLEPSLLKAPVQIEDLYLAARSGSRADLGNPSIQARSEATLQRFIIISTHRKGKRLESRFFHPSSRDWNREHARCARD